jgi:hypothetical protein
MAGQRMKEVKGRGRATILVVLLPGGNVYLSKGLTEVRDQNLWSSTCSWKGEASGK